MLMAKPPCEQGNVRPSLQQTTGYCMSNDIRRSTLGSQAVAFADCRLEGLAEQT